MKAFIDADIIISYLRGDYKAHDFMQKLRNNNGYELWISAMVRAEIVFFMRPQEEERTQDFLTYYKTASIDQACVDLAGKLYRKWNPSHGTGINDAILAALVINNGGKIYCLNKKHYPMPEIVVEKPF